MKIELKDIGFADCPVIETKINLQSDSVIIIFDGANYSTEQESIGKFKLSITKWLEFIITKNLYDNVTDQSKTIILEHDKLETFTLIQELFFKNNTFILNGWSLESGSWLTYEFNFPEVEVEKLNS